MKGKVTHYSLLTTDRIFFYRGFEASGTRRRGALVVGKIDFVIYDGGLRIFFPFVSGAREHQSRVGGQSEGRSQGRKSQGGHRRRWRTGGVQKSKIKKHITQTNASAWMSFVR